MIKKIHKIFDKSSLIKVYILIIGLLVLALLETLSLGTIPIFISFIIDSSSVLQKLSDIKIIPELIINFLRTNDSIFFINFLIIAIFVSKNLYYSLIFYYQGLVLRNTIAKISNKLFTLYIFSSYEKFTSKNSSYLINNVTNEVGQCFQFLNSLATIIRESVVLILLFIMAFYLDPNVTSIIFLLFLVISSIYFLTLKKKLKEIGLSSIKYKKDFFLAMTEGFGLLKEVKLLKVENYFINRFKSKNAGMYRTQHIRSFLSTMPKPFLEIASVSVLVSLSIFLLTKNGNSESIIPTLTLVTVIAIRLIPAFNLITSSLALMKSSYPSLELIYKEFENLEADNKVINSDDNVILNSYTNDKDHENIINIKELNFNYQSSNKKILKDLNLSIKKNKFLSIIGESGCGKSTLIEIILGLLKPSSGSVTHYLSKDSQPGQKLKIGYVPQSIFLIDDTIKRNIAIGINEEDINEKRVHEVIKLSELSSFVSDLENGIETRVGERGGSLSGGQIQRIGLARALYNDPEVLILDEATSALDLETEKKIIDLLSPMRKNKTMIMVTHRTWNMDMFDTIIEIKNGRCSEVSTEKNKF